MCFKRKTPEISQWTASKQLYFNKTNQIWNIRWYTIKVITTEIVAITNSWIVTVYSACYSFHFLFQHFISNSTGVSRKAEDAYPTATHGPLSELLINFSFLVCVTFVLSCSWLCVWVYFPSLVLFLGLYSFDFCSNLGFLITLLNEVKCVFVKE